MLIKELFIKKKNVRKMLQPSLFTPFEDSSDYAEFGCVI